MVDYSIFELTDSEMIVTAHFPVYAEGKSAYYTMYDKVHSTVVSRRNTGVVDQSKGTFSVDLKSFLTSSGTFIIVFDIEGTGLAASEKVIVKDYEIEQRDFQEFNAAKNPTKVVIKKTRTNDFADAHKSVELNLEYNSDNTPSKMEEKKL